MAESDHVEAQLDAISHLTFQQWFTGRAAYVRTHQPAAADQGEQAMRADYIADKAWWYRIYQPEQFPTFAHAARAASQELPTPQGVSRTMRRGWLEQIDAAITAASRNIPSHQWSTTLIPAHVITGLARSSREA